MGGLDCGLAVGWFVAVVQLRLPQHLRPHQHRLLLHPPQPRWLPQLLPLLGGGLAGRSIGAFVLHLPVTSKAARDAGRFVVPAQSGADWLDAGGRWLALHGTSGGRAVPIADGRPGRTMSKARHHQVNNSR